MDETFKERQRRENQKYYEKWLACGFTGEMELNEHGWFIPVLRLHHPVETMTIFDKNCYRARIEWCQLPNKKWVAASDLSCPLHGYGSAVSVWDSQYETKNEAITAELNRIEKALEPKDRKPFVLDAIQTCRNKFKEIDVELAFEPTAQFAQVALF